MSPHTPFSESDWEGLVMEALGEHGWRPTAGEQIAPGTGERAGWDELLIRPRLLDALQRINPTVPVQYLKQALAELTAPRSQDAITENYRIHQMLVYGYNFTYLDADGIEQNPSIRLISHDESQNDWLVARQVTLVQGDHQRRFDVVLYLNGLPVSIVELKRAGSKTEGVEDAHAQLQTYLREFPLAFRFCVMTLISDGIEAKYGTPFTPLNHFSPWNVDDDGLPVPRDATRDGAFILPIEIAVDGLYNQTRFLQLIQWFTAFDEGADGLTKRIAKPHQYFAVTKAVGSTVDAVRTSGKAGVVWHTQGSGKSMEMELYTNRVMKHPALTNPTVIVITDRNELDGQLFATFSRSRLLPEEPKQIRRRSDLRTELSERLTGGIYFTTLQKFGRTQSERESGEEHPLLSERRNIIVVVDEAHRSHYDDLDGYARHLRDALPNATLIAFTGTPISFVDRNTREVFGDYIDIYDLSRAVDDGATVPVYFEPRLIKVQVADGITEETLNAAADEATVGLDESERVRIEQAVAVVNAVYGAPERLEELAKDLVAHWEKRRDAVAPVITSANAPPAHGKAMVVGGTREICANLYEQIIKLRPHWHSDDLDQGKIKVVYSGRASDQPPVSTHVRRDSANNVIKNRLKDPEDPLELVIVKDMMLTGFDSPPLHTLYLDRPLKGALLMQTLARVNRTFRGKESGLLVAYAPLAENLAKALKEYSQRDAHQRPMGKDIEAASRLLEQFLAEIRELLAGYDWRSVMARGGKKAFIRAVHGAVNYLRAPENQQVGTDSSESVLPRAQQFRQKAGGLTRAWALCTGSGRHEDIRPEIQFYEEIRVWMAKFDAADRQARGEPVPDEVQRTLATLIDTATDATGEVLDIYAAAGMLRPTLDELTPEFLESAQDAPNPTLAIEALRKLIREESIRTTGPNRIRQRAFADRINELMMKYTNQQLTSAEIIAELIDMASEVAAEGNRGQQFSPPLDADELAFYDAVAQNHSAVEHQGSGILADIARQLVEIMRRDVRTDWTVREDVRAKLRSSVKRLLVLNGYPPDKQPEAIKLVIEQMEAMSLSRTT